MSDLTSQRSRAMTDAAKHPEWPVDPRGGVFFDFGDGRGRIHETDLSQADRDRAGLPALPASTEPDEAESASPIRESDNA